jgi:branched-chain amino acid aminotransferase
MVDSEWIPKDKGYSLYIRECFELPGYPGVDDQAGPTMIGTQNALGVGPSSDALLFVICSPVSEDDSL